LYSADGLNNPSQPYQFIAISPNRHRGDLQHFCQGDIGGASLAVDQVKNQGRSIFQTFRRGQGSMGTVIYSQAQQDICDILTPVLVMMRLSESSSEGPVVDLLSLRARTTD
jgi:hypothetical protein